MSPIWFREWRFYCNFKQPICKNNKFINFTSNTENMDRNLLFEHDPRTFCLHCLFNCKMKSLECVFFFNFSFCKYIFCFRLRAQTANPTKSWWCWLHMSHLKGYQGRLFLFTSRLLYPEWNLQWLLWFILLYLPPYCAFRGFPLQLSMTCYTAVPLKISNNWPWNNFELKKKFLSSSHSQPRTIIAWVLYIGWNPKYEEITSRNNFGWAYGRICCK